jgi:tetratricopeptide (TPR) repeat protein
MPTANTLRPLHEELHLLARAVEGDTFHFVVVQWHHLTLVKQAEEYLRQQYPERAVLAIRVQGQSYEALTEKMYGQGTGFLFIEDFENLLADPDLYIAFNQRRGKFARMPVSIIGFIPPGERFVEQCIRHLPDWWSVRTLLAELHAPPAPLEQPTFSWIEPPAFSTLGGPGQPERLEEIQNLQKRLTEIAIAPENVKLLDNLYGQLLEILQTAGLYQAGLDAANQWLKVAFALDYEHKAPNTFASALNWLGVFEQYLGHYTRAARLMERALEIESKYLGEEYPNIAVYQSNLANVYRNLGDYERARDLLEAAMASDLKKFGKEHPNVAVCQSNLANVYYVLGDYERARDLLEAALASDLKNFGKEHPNVALRQSNLASVYADLGDYKRARDLQEAALTSAVKNFGNDHPNVAVCQSNLANIYADLGEYERARDLLKAALASDLKNFGKEHPKVAVRQISLGAILWAAGEKQKAKALFQQAHNLFKKHFGEQHPETQNAKQWLEKT